MKTYKVKVTMTYTHEIEVEAENEWDAEETLEEEYLRTNPELWIKMEAPSKDSQPMSDKELKEKRGQGLAAPTC